MKHLTMKPLCDVRQTPARGIDREDLPPARSLCGGVTVFPESLPRHMKRSAFSLNEMLVVITLMAILSAVAIPKWAGAMQSQRIKQAATRIVADLSRAQEAAYNTSTAKVVTFTVGSSQYLVSGVTPLDRRSGPYLVTLSDHPYSCTLVSVWGQTGTQTITFDGFGSPDKGGNIILASGSYRKTIVVDPGTGTAVIQ